jgi:hypothetical protein
MFVLCVSYSKDKRQKPGQSGQGSTDKVQRENRKKTPGARMFVSCECCVSSGRSLCDGLIPRLEKFY